MAALAWVIEDFEALMRPVVDYSNLRRARVRCLLCHQSQEYHQTSASGSEHASDDGEHRDRQAARDAGDPRHTFWCRSSDTTRHKDPRPICTPRDPWTPVLIFRTSPRNSAGILP